MDNSPTSLFETYEQDFKQLIDGIRDKLEGEGRNERGEQRKITLRRVEMELEEADEMVEQMQLEIQSMPQSIKPSYKSRVDAAKSELKRFKNSARDQHSAISRSELLSDIGGSPYRDSISSTGDAAEGGRSNDRTRLLAGTALLEDGSRRLQDSHRVALETEEQGAEILRSLRGQREQIVNARNTLQTADNSIDRASGTLKGMIRRMYQQRVVTAAIIVVLVILIAIILWEKLHK